MKPAHVKNVVAVAVEIASVAVATASAVAETVVAVVAVVATVSLAGSIFHPDIDQTMSGYSPPVQSKLSFLLQFSFNPNQPFFLCRTSFTGGDLPQKSSS